ncbi:MAG: hypothetical protein ACXADS_12330 [Candidatus Thorarchaeota archaeon]|jgi:hypothetical protein
MRRPFIVIVLIGFLMYPTLAAPFSPVGGIQVISLPTWDGLSPEWTSSPAEGPLAYSGTGAARDVDISGVYSSGGSTTLDGSNPGYVGLNLPTGWTADHLTTSIDELSLWVDDVVINQELDSYHNERWLFTGPDSANNGIDFRVPDGWTIVKSDPTTGSQHPTQGNFELSGSTGAGYGNTMGWEFEANYGATTPLEPTNEVCLSQLISAPWREIYSVEISFLYFVRSLSSMDNNVHLFARFGDYEGKVEAFGVGNLVDTWVETKVTVPYYYLQTLSLPNSVLLEIGLGTDIDGQPGLGGSHAAYIDGIEVRLNVRPFPEEIGLKANGVFVEGGVTGSVSPYVPVGANRDCLSNYSSGIDPNGRSDNGILEVGAAVPDYPDWSTAYAYQVGLQFRLDVPQGAAITSAYFAVEAEAGAQYLPSMRIYVADEDNVGSFTSGLPELKDQFNWVDTNIVWDPSQWSANVRYGSPDISGLLQQVVSRPGWQSDNYILIMLDYAYSTQDFAWNNVKGSSNYPQADLARLFVNYLAPHPEDIVHSLENSKTLTIDHSNVASDLTDFPLLIDIWDSDLRSSQMATTSAS